jgi:hypothetical protein
MVLAEAGLDGESQFKAIVAYLGRGEGREMTR